MAIGKYFSLLICVGAVGFVGCTKAAQNSSGDENNASGGVVTTTTVPVTTTTIPGSSSTTTTQPPPVTTLPPSADQDLRVVYDVAFQQATLVDNYYSSYRELLEGRKTDSSHFTDRCDAKVSDRDQFADYIAYYVYRHLKLTTPKISSIASLFGVSMTGAKPVSLGSHRMCSVSRSSFAATVSSSKVPSDAVIAKLNTFANRYNASRDKLLGGDLAGRDELVALWSRLYMCLAYSESLTTADTTSSGNVAKKYAPSDYRKPAGVKFYEDPAQDAASRLNIGLYQFTPTASGNIFPCIDQWNEDYPSCKINRTGNQSEMIRTVGSSFQAFNAFCGVNKVDQSFFVQVNTSQSGNTHPSNLSGGKLLPPDQRCVSLHFAPGKTYQHFGPFMNSTGSNLGELMTCVLR